MPNTMPPEASARLRPAVVLMNDAALDLPLDMLPVDGASGVIVAGQSVLRMTLAELSFPGARLVWTDLRQSASLRNLHGTIQALGGLDRLILAADGAEAEAMFSVMCAVLTFLPALRKAERGRIELVVFDGPAVPSLSAFVRQLQPRLDRDGIRLVLRVTGRVEPKLVA
jgi:hypothetical protein